MPPREHSGIGAVTIGSRITNQVVYNAATAQAKSLDLKLTTIMNRQEKLIQLAMCFALVILAAQNIGIHSIWVSALAFVCMFEKKIFGIVRRYVDTSQANNRRLNDTEQRLFNLKDKT